MSFTADAGGSIGEVVGSRPKIRPVIVMTVVVFGDHLITQARACSPWLANQTRGASERSARWA